MGTDDYSHLFLTNIMASSRGISEFYETAGATVNNPSSDSNAYNYPFGLWLFGATIAKMTGLPPISADFFFVILFLLIIIGTFYAYSGIWLESREQKVCAVLFLISMPYISLTLLSYWPTMFTLPFLLLILYFFLKEPVNWKLLPFAWLSLFIIVIGHAGTFFFLITFCLVFFLLYCLFWGKFLKSLYCIIMSTLVIYVISLTWFPQIASQFDYRSSMFLLPGNFLATKFNFPLLLDLTQVFYENLFLERQIIYVVILGAILYVLALSLTYINRKIITFFFEKEKFYAFTLPLQNLSHSVGTSPLWLGPVQVFLSVFGVFHLNSKGKCFLITALLTTLPPNMLQESQGIIVETGALREIIYLLIIIPITATLGFWHILDYLNDPTSKVKKHISSLLWIGICATMIITPALANAYYLPIIAGEDYTIRGMEWLGENGDHTGYVSGYGLRTVPIYTNMTSSEYNLPSGSDTTQYVKLLDSIYFWSGERTKEANDLLKYFGTRYILSSDKLSKLFGGTQETLTIDSQSALSKIYSSNDFGIYEISTSSEKPVPDSYLADNISLKQRGGSYEIQSAYYKITLSERNPTISHFGTPQQDLLESGYFSDSFRIFGTGINPQGDSFNLPDMEFTPEIMDNQITYRTLLRNPQNQAPEATLLVRYTFYPTVVKREYILSNDWLVANNSPEINVWYTISIFSPLTRLVVTNENTRLERHIIAMEDTPIQYLNIENVFLNDGKNGIYMAFSPLSPQPSQIWYSGTINNQGSVGIFQPNAIKPGASFASTQFLFPGSESDAKKYIQNIQGIELLNYPDGIIPVMISGIRWAQSERTINENITNGYAVLKNNSIPYSEVVYPSLRIENATDLQNVTVPSVNLQEIANNNITIIGSQVMRGQNYDNLMTQETNMNILYDYMKQQGVSFTGFMPESYNYNLDTLTILSGNKIPFIFSNEIDPTTKGYWFPQLALINGEPAGVVLFPVSSLTSFSLSSQPSTEDIFSNWRAKIDTAADNDEMLLLLLRSQDIGNPLFTDNFAQLFSYAREKGLTFTSPILIAEHFKQLQNIRYSGFIDGDTASIQVTNNNPVNVGNVTFKVTLPDLADGNYRVNYGSIVRTKSRDNQSVLYIGTEVPSDSTINIIIEPDMPRKSFHIELPQQPLIEGSNTITVKDEAGNPIRGVDVLLDTVYYQTDKNGVVKLDLSRDYHTITVQSPGYEKYSISFTVRGRIFNIEKIVGQIF